MRYLITWKKTRWISTTFYFNNLIILLAIYYTWFHAYGPPKGTQLDNTRYPNWLAHPGSSPLLLDAGNTFFAVNLINCFLSTRVISLAKLQLVGIMCLFITSKVNKIELPLIIHFLHQCSNSSYTENGIFQVEQYILKMLKWDFSYPNPIHFLRRVSKADECDVKATTITKYLLEISCLEWRPLSAPPSLLAAAAFWFARLILNNETWVGPSTPFYMFLAWLLIWQTPNLAHYSSYAESQLVPTANIMLNYVHKPTKHRLFYKKCAGKKYLKFHPLTTSALLATHNPTL